MPDYIYSGFGCESVQRPQFSDSEPNLICQQGSLELIWLRVYAEPSETGLRKHRFVPLLVMMGPAVRRAFPDAPGGGFASSRLRRRSQICRLHHNTSVLADVTSRHSLADLGGGGLPALAGCSHPCGKVWWRSAGTLWTSFGVCVWRNGRPRRKNVPSDSRRSRRLSSVGLYCNYRKHTDGLLVMLKY